MAKKQRGISPDGTELLDFSSNPFPTYYRHQDGDKQVKMRGHADQDDREITIVLPRVSGSLAIIGDGGSIDLSDYYTKSEVELLINDLDVEIKNDYYNKTEIDKLLADFGSDSDELQAQIDALEVLVTQNQNDISKNAMDISVNTTAISNNTNDIKANTDLITKNKDNILKNQQEIESLKSQVEAGKDKASQYVWKEPTNYEDNPDEGDFYAGNGIGFVDEIKLTEYLYLSKVDDDVVSHNLDAIEKGDVIEADLGGDNPAHGVFQVDSVELVNDTHAKIKVIPVRTAGKWSDQNMSSGVDSWSMSFMLGLEVEAGNYYSKTESDNLFASLIQNNTLKGTQTITGNVDIDASGKSDDIEGVLKLKGNRKNSVNPAAAIRFNNAQSSAQGEIAYRSYGSSHWFGFNRDVDLNNNGLHTVAQIRLKPGGYIGSQANPRLIFNNANNGNQGGGLLVVPRPDVDRRGFVIRGNDASGKQQDMFYTYTNPNGTPDAVNYEGKIASDTNLVNKKYVDDSIEGLPLPDLSDYYTKSEVDSSQAEQDGKIDDKASTQYVDDAIDNIDFPSPDLSGYMPLDGNSIKTGKLVLKTDEATPFEIKSANGTSIFKMWSSGAVALEKPYDEFKDNELVTKKYVDDSMAGAPLPDLSNYYTKVEVDEKIDGIPLPDLSDYMTEAETIEYVDNAPYLSDKGGQLDGALTIKKSNQVALDIVGDGNTSQIKFWSSGAVALQNYTDFKANELVTKKYVDDKVGSGGGGGFTAGDQVAKTDGESTNIGGFWISNGNLYCKVN